LLSALERPPACIKESRISEGVLEITVPVEQKEQRRRIQIESDKSRS
jgi:hypothetical protein